VDTFNKYFLSAAGEKKKEKKEKKNIMTPVSTT
jgi:hypothetical protein